MANETCTMRGCELPKYAQLRCRRHYLQWTRAAKQQHLEETEPKSPDELPVPVLEVRTMTAFGRSKWAVVVAPPPVDGTQPCMDDPHAFDEASGAGGAARLMRARLLCADCCWLVQCREYGLAHEEYMVWGGLAHSERMSIRKARGQALLPLDQVLVEVAGNADSA